MTGWRPPAGLGSAAPGDPDGAPLWFLFAAARLDEVAAAVAARQKAEPGWAPSSDLARKVARKALRNEVLAAAGSADWRRVAGLAASGAVGEDDEDVELVWAVADGFARTGRVGDAYRLYAGILAHATDPAARRSRKP